MICLASNKFIQHQRTSVSLHEAHLLLLPPPPPKAPTPRAHTHADPTLGAHAARARTRKRDLPRKRLPTLLKKKEGSKPREVAPMPQRFFRPSRPPFVLLSCVERTSGFKRGPSSPSPKVILTTKPSKTFISSPQNNSNFCFKSGCNCVSEVPRVK